jgi:hypothetical protein
VAGGRRSSTDRSPDEQATAVFPARGRGAVDLEIILGLLVVGTALVLVSAVIKVGISVKPTCALNSAPLSFFLLNKFLGVSFWGKKSNGLPSIFRDTKCGRRRGPARTSELGSFYLSVTDFGRSVIDCVACDCAP